MDNDVEECFNAQLSEVELLRAMYDDTELFDLDVPTSNEPAEVCFKMHLKVDAIMLKIRVRFPKLYPLKAKPIIFVHSQQVDECSLRRQLDLFIEQQELELPIINDVLTWLTRNTKDFIPESDPMPAKPKYQPPPVKYARFWIPTHHIYSNDKINIILKAVKDLNLGGFIAPGKPGAVLVEGELESCHEFYRRIVNLNWREISCETEELQNEHSMKFNREFEKIMLPVINARHVQTVDIKTKLEGLGLVEYYYVLYKLRRS